MNSIVNSVEIPMEAWQSLYIKRPVRNSKEWVAWVYHMGIPHIVETWDLHVTQVYSKTKVKHLPIHVIENDRLIVRPSNIQIWDHDNGYRTLVVTLQAPSLNLRNDILRMWDAKEDYPYTPHMSLSYDPHGISFKNFSWRLKRLINWMPKYVYLGPEILSEI